MTTATTLRQAAAVLLAEADRIDGRISSTVQMTTYAGRSVTIQEAWEAMLAEIAAGERPRAWRDWVPGVPPDQVGDNDPVDPELLRVFRPFHDAATREGVEDSAGARFFLPTIKKRAGIGPKASGEIRDETRRIWESKWGEDWRAHEANIAAGHVPKAEDVARIFGKVYG